MCVMTHLYDADSSATQTRAYAVSVRVHVCVCVCVCTVHSSFCDAPECEGALHRTQSFPGVLSQKIKLHCVQFGTPIQRFQDSVSTLGKLTRSYP